VANPLFDKLKEEFSTNPEAWVEGFGFHVNGCPGDKIQSDHTCKEDPKGDFCTWWADTGNFNCKRCGEKSTDIVDSYRLIQGIDGDHAATRAAEELAEEKGVAFEKYDPNKHKKELLSDLPRFMDADRLSMAQSRLLGPEGAACRHFINKKWHVNADDITHLGIGSWHSAKDKGEVLIIATFDERSGLVSPRYKKQLPVIRTAREKRASVGKRDRIWNSGSTTPPPRMWIQEPPDPDLIEEFVVVEGESDLITAHTRLDWPSLGIWPVAVFGKTTTPTDQMFPKYMEGKRVTVLLDMDAFQGPIGDIKGTDQQKARTRTSTLGEVKRLSEFFRKRNCDVSIATVAGKLLDPVQAPTGDLKDWVDAGGRSLGQLRSWTHEEIYAEIDTVKEVATVEEARATQQQLISVVGVVAAIDETPAFFPTETVISCAFGDEAMARSCAKCGVPRRIGPEQKQLIPWDSFPAERAKVIASEDPDGVIAREVCQKPHGCTLFALEHTATQPGVRWEIQDLKPAEGSQALPVLSEGNMPPVVGRVKVTGRVFAVKNKLCLVAQHVEPMDSNTVDIEPVKGDLLTTFQHATDNPDVLWEEICAIGRDVSDHVTSIGNREDLHVGTLLTMGSCLWFLNEDGRQTRGWLDITIMGHPREGKSSTVSRLFSEFGMGLHTQSSAAGSSVAGLTASSASMKRVDPGTWPKHHGRCIALDEMQNFFTSRVSPMRALQSARGDGVIDSNKCTGNTSFPAAVRAIFISNFPQNRNRFMCQDLLPMYEGTTQGIARTDFPLFVNDNVKFEKFGVVNKYRLPMLKTLVQRAWSQQPHEIVIRPEAFQLARSQCDRWGDVYDQSDLPLFCGHEKAESIMRIAIAAANLTFSHSSSDATFRSVEVRKVHVQFAIKWLEYCWEEAGYRQFSEFVMRRHRVVDPVGVAAVLTADCSAEEIEARLTVIQMPGDHRQVVAGMPGHTFQEQMGFFNILIQKNVLSQQKNESGRTEIAPTRGGKELMARICDLAVEHPDLYDKAREQWKHWREVDTPMATTPLDLSNQEELDLFIQNEGLW
jgi:hypothetical protein